MPRKNPVTRQSLEVFSRFEKIRSALMASNKQFANAVGMSESAYANWKQARIEAPNQAIVQCSLRFGVSLDWLYDGIEPIFLSSPVIHCASCQAKLSEQSAWVGLYKKLLQPRNQAT